MFLRPTIRKIVIAPLQRLVRREIDNAMHRESESIPLALQRRAVESTADYIDKNLYKAQAYDSASTLLLSALAQADLGGNRLICEFGVFSGSTINQIAAQTTSTVYGFDSFEGLPEDWRPGFSRGHFAVSTLPQVRHNVQLIKGWFIDTLPEFLKKTTEDVGFLHVDCDLHSSTETIFQLLSERLKPGCVIVFDEYFNFPGWQKGEFKAFQEFIKNSKLNYEYIGYNQHHQQVAVVLKSNH